MNRDKYLAKNTAIFTLGNLGPKLISFFLVSIYTEALTTEQYGVADLFTTICTLMIPVVTLNVAESLMRFALDKDADHSRIMGVGICNGIIGIVLMLILIPVSNYIPSIKEYSSLLYLYCASFAVSQIFMCYLRGAEKLLQYAIGSILQAASIAVLNIIFLLPLDMGLEGYFLSYIISYVIVSVYAFFAGKVYKLIGHLKFDWKLFKQMSKYAMALIPNSLMWWITNSSDRIMITSFLGAAANGLYSVSYKIPSTLSVFSSIFSQAWSYSAIRENESKDNEEYTNQMYENLLSTLIILAGGLLLIIKPFMKIYVSEDYFTAWKYCPFLILGFLYMSMGTFVATPYIVHKDSFHMMMSGVGGAVLNIILNFILIPKIGIQGAAVATCVSYIAIYVIRLADTQRYVKVKPFPGKTLAATILLWIMLFTVYIDSWLGLAAAAVEFIILVILLRQFVIKIADTVLSKLKPSK